MACSVALVLAHDRSPALAKDPQYAQQETGESGKTLLRTHYVLLVIFDLWFERAKVELFYLGAPGAQGIRRKFSLYVICRRTSNFGAWLPAL